VRRDAPQPFAVLPTDEVVLLFVLRALLPPLQLAVEVVNPYDQ
jgi:hypothetical protein